LIDDGSSSQTPCTWHVVTTKQTDITAARLTAPGRGAVASVRLSCSQTEQAEAIDNAFTAANGMRASSAPVDRVVFGSWRGEDVVVVRTAETEWEVHCHGGEAAVTRIMAEFGSGTSSAAVPESSLERLLLQTRTTKTARLVLAHSAGLLRNTLVAAAEARTIEIFRQQLNDLLRWEWIVDHFVESWRVVIAGPPNTGKSSLLNAIAGYQRSIVFDQAGTTRDAVRTELVLNGWPFCFVDTAGIRQESDDPIEVQGIAHARNLLETADLVLLAVDNTVGWTNDHDGILAGIPDQTPRGVVCCKADLDRAGELSSVNASVLTTSAEQGDGIRELTDWITAQLIPEEPTMQTALPLAGTVTICHTALERLNLGESLKSQQQNLLQWLQTQVW
jgi:tRNA modification GTPase